MNGCGRPRVSEQGCSHLHRRPPRQDHAHDRYLATFHASKKRGPYGCTEVTQPKSEIYRLRLTLFLLLCFFCFSSSGLNMTQAKLTVTRRITAPRTITVSIAASSAVVFIAILFLLSSSDTPITRQSGSAESLEKEHQRSIAMLRQNEGFTKVVQSAEGARNTLPLGVGSLVPLLSESRLHVTSEKIRHNTPVRADPRGTTTLERDSFNFLT